MSALHALAETMLLAAGAAGEPPPSLARFDDKAIAVAVRATVAEMPKLQVPEGRADFGSAGAAEPEARRKIDRAFAAAVVPDCLRSDATKRVPIQLGGILGLPGWAYAAATGKCK